MSPRFVVGEAIRLMESRRGLEAVEKYFSPDYIEHNPTIPGGNLKGFVQLLKDEGFSELNPRDRQLEFHHHHFICEGEHVVVHHHVTEPGKPTLVFMDIYRVQDGKIVEHWDAIQPVPENPTNKRYLMW
jgi:predicted SnoaL-like aldol condensation-catalyzing enzyme